MKATIEINSVEELRDLISPGQHSIQLAKWTWNKETPDKPKTATEIAGWRTPKRGDRVRCVKSVDERWGDGLSSMAVGSEHVVEGACACSPLKDEHGEVPDVIKDPDVYFSLYRFGIFFKDDCGVLRSAPLEFFEPLT